MKKMADATAESMVANSIRPIPLGAFIVVAKPRAHWQQADRTKNHRENRN